MIRTGVTGATGRMGRIVIQRVMAASGFELVAAFERKDSPGIGVPLGDSSSLRGGNRIRIESMREDSLRGLDVLIDFTAPQATLEHVEKAEKAKVAMVIGTTGVEEKGERSIKKASSRIPIVMAPNMSVGANLLFELTRLAGSTLLKYDAEIVEAHHRMKKDAPSGTARRLAQEIARARGWDTSSFVYGRKGTADSRREREIGIHALRAGDIVGRHNVIFSGPGETVELVHQALSREAFAEGAIRAARFIVKKKRGLYDMRDVLAKK